jgi:hypothetical protein
MYDIRDFYCTEFLGRGQFAEVLKGMHSAEMFLFGEASGPNKGL